MSAGFDKSRFVGDHAPDREACSSTSRDMIHSERRHLCHTRRKISDVPTNVDSKLMCKR